MNGKTETMMHALWRHHIVPAQIAHVDNRVLQIRKKTMYIKEERAKLHDVQIKTTKHNIVATLIQETLYPTGVALLLALLALLL